MNLATMSGKFERFSLHKLAQYYFRALFVSLSRKYNLKSKAIQAASRAARGAAAQTTQSSPAGEIISTTTSAKNIKAQLES